MVMKSSVLICLVCYQPARQADTRTHTHTHAHTHTHTHTHTLTQVQISMFLSFIIFTPINLNI